MPRPRKYRKVCCLPRITEFTPRNGSESHEVIVMSVDEYETIRLIDKQGFSQEECGNYMKIARTTVQMIYTSARKKIADALVDGIPLRIEGGEYQLCDGEEDICACGGCRKHRCRNLAMMREQNRKEGKAMRILLPVDEDKCTICPVFGRAPYFMIVNSKTGEKELMENPATDAQEGAGTKAAQFVLDCNADIVITPRLGSNSGEAFKEAGIQIYKSEGTNPDDNVKAWMEHKLSFLENFHSGYHGIR